MNIREKRLMFAVLGLAGLFGAGFGLHALLVRPLRAVEAKTANLRSQLALIKKEKRTFFDQEVALKAVAHQTFADQVSLASARSGEMLTRLILASGLPDSDFSRLPLGPTSIRGAQELGWSIDGSGPLDKIVNLIFLLEETPVVHRVENLSVSPGEQPGHVRVSFRYMTLIIDPPLDMVLTNVVPTPNLNLPQRRRLDIITTRNFLRPFQPPPPATVPTPQPSAPPNPALPASPGPETFRIVSLSQWQGRPEIHVRDLGLRRTLRYTTGDSLAGGTIAMVDYRPFPKPGREWLQSYARVILKVDQEYWAIEQGATLAEKYRLPKERWPDELAKK